MALRGPNRPNVSPLKPADTQAPGAKLSNIEAGLLQAGIAKTPQEAKKLARTLLQALRGKGVPANSLPLAIKQFQKDAGLKQTGQLNPKTLEALTQQGLLPAGDKGAKAPAKPGGPTGPAAGGRGDVVVKGPQIPGQLTGKPAGTPRPIGTQGKPTGEATHRVAIDQTAALVEHMNPADGFGPQDLLANLGGMGFLAGGKGADQLRNTLKAFQGQMGLPPSGKLDPETVQKLVEAGLLPESAAQHLGQGEGHGASAAAGGGGKDGTGASTAARGEAAATAGHEQARADTDQASQDAHVRGLAEGKGDPDAKEGRGAEGKGRAKKKGKGGDGDAFEGEGEGGVDEGDEDGTESLDANAHAGDDDFNEEDRGHAQLKREEAEVGHYAIAPLSEQLAEALEQIERDDDGRGPVTYRWDITFYKPGVYGPHQPAEPLWHIGIEKVTAFDEVWRNASKALAERMASMEPEVPPPTHQDFERALRRARARSTP